ncbi:MAG TPA: hypothetical protein PL009_07435 [Flavipsychrobacter sp.]|nr:hypothetical protein [Flavipsychrobacter sp.]
MHLKVGFYILFILTGLPKIAITQTINFEPAISKRINKFSAYPNLKVIDSTSQSNLGKVKFGLYAKTLEVVVKPSLSEALQKLSSSLLPIEPLSTDTLILLLYDFNFTTNAPYASLYFRGFFFLGRENKYRLVKVLDTLYEWENERLERTMLPHASDLFADVLIDLNEQVNFSTENITHFRFDEMAHFLTRKKSENLLFSAKHYKEGIYPTVEDFLAHQPLDTMFLHGYILKDMQKVSEFYFLDARGKKVAYVRSAFAVFSKGEWYRRTKNGWQKLQYENDDFVFEANYLCGGTTFSAPAMIAGGIMFGVPGVLLAGVATKTDETLCRYKMRIDPVNKRIRRIKRL